MCKDDDNVSPYLRRRLRSYWQAMRNRDAKAAGATDRDNNAKPNVAPDQTNDDKASEICKCDHHRDGEA